MLTIQESNFGSCAWFLLGIGGWHDGAMESDGGTVTEEASLPGVLSVSAKICLH